MARGVYFSPSEIRIDKHLNKLDEFVIGGVRLISRFFPRYAIVAGYIAILFGRSRATEDVDVLVHPEVVTRASVGRFYVEAGENGYWIFNAKSPDHAYGMMKRGLSVRVAKSDSVVPNFEIKMARSGAELEAIRKRIRVFLNGSLIYASPIELNIAHGLYRGSQRDVEDAVYLYCFFEEYIDVGELHRYLSQLGVSIDDAWRVLRC